MAHLINVDNLVNRVKLDESVIGSDEISRFYGSTAPIVFKDEVKMVIPGNVDGEPIKLQANILTSDRLQQIRNVKLKGKDAAYLHLGFVPIVIRSLLPSGNEKISGRCALVDTSRTSSETAVIDQFEFVFTKKQPFAAKLLTINASVDINCKISVGSIQILLELSGIDLREERSVAAIVTGLTCTPTNQMVLLHKIECDTPKWSLCNIIEQVEDEEESKTAFKKMFEASSSNLIDIGKEEWLDKGKRLPIFGKFSMKGYGKELMPVRRRNLTTKNLIKDYMSQVKSETGSLKRSASLRLNNSLLESYLRDQARSSVDLINTKDNSNAKLDGDHLMPIVAKLKDLGVTSRRVAEDLEGKIEFASTSGASDGTK